MGSKRNIPSMLPKNIMAVCIEIQHPLHRHMFTVFVLFFSFNLQNECEPEPSG